MKPKVLAGSYHLSGQSQSWSKAGVCAPHHLRTLHDFLFPTSHGHHIQPAKRAKLLPPPPEWNGKPKNLAGYIGIHGQPFWFLALQIQQQKLQSFRNGCHTLSSDPQEQLHSSTTFTHNMTQAFWNILQEMLEPNISLTRQLSTYTSSYFPRDRNMHLSQLILVNLDSCPISHSKIPMDSPWGTDLSFLLNSRNHSGYYSFINKQESEAHAQQTFASHVAPLVRELQLHTAPSWMCLSSASLDIPLMCYVY